MKLSDLLRGARAGEPTGRPRRRRTRRPDAPRTIVPALDEAAPEARCAVAPPSPFDLRVDAARERLRRAIPPVDDAE